MYTPNDGRSAGENGDGEPDAVLKTLSWDENDSAELSSNVLNDYTNWWKVIGEGFLVGGGIGLGGTAAGATGIGVPLGSVETAVDAGAVLDGGVLFINEWNNFLNGPSDQTRNTTPLILTSPIASACR